MNQLRLDDLHVSVGSTVEKILVNISLRVIFSKKKYQPLYAVWSSS
jgi:hypothetical protein